jgi:hypothetical protein
VRQLARPVDGEPRVTDASGEHIAWLERHTLAQIREAAAAALAEFAPAIVAVT